MPLYSVRCKECGEFEVNVPIAQRDRPHPCPECQHQTDRVLSPPHLTSYTRALDRAFDQAGTSSESPKVVRSIPATAAGTSPHRRSSGRYPALPRP